MFKIYFKVIPINGFKKSLTYYFESINKNEIIKIKIGDFVKIPIKNNFYWGIIFFIYKTPPIELFEIKIINKILYLNKNYKFFLKKLSNHYLMPINFFYKKIVSFGNKKTIFLENEILKKKTEKIKLNEEQKLIFENIKNNILNNKKRFYLHGITGSGKTLIYIFLAKYFLEEKKENVLIIFPDTILAIYAFEKIKEILKQELSEEKFKIFSFHSESSETEKNSVFSLFENNIPSIIIGVHVAVFLPIKNIGLYIIDEEHDSGFLEKSYPFINSRDALIVKNEIENKTILLCSATPSIESWHKIKNNFYQFYSMKNKFFEKGEIEIEKVILNENNLFENYKLITKKLVNEIKKNLEEKKQIILFLNQKGIFKIIKCKNCKKFFGCNECSSLYTLYENFICICNRCKKKIILPELCVYCKKNKFIFESNSIGTSKLKIDIEKIFPESVIVQADSKSITNKKSWKNLILKMENKEIDILIGTKIISRGYHFKNIELIGIICADIHLGIPHYSSHEKILQELIQISGRTGRENYGKIILQTFSDQYFYDFLDEKNYLKFCDEELNFRKNNEFPPFKKIALIFVIGRNENSTKKCAEEFFEYLLKNNINEYNSPLKSYFYKIKNYYYYFFYGKSNSYENLNNIFLKKKEIESFEKKFDTKIKYLPNPEKYSYEI